MAPTKTKIRISILMECEPKDLEFCKDTTNNLITEFVERLPASLYHKISMTTPKEELDDEIPF